MAQYLVTGGAGFIGSHIVDHALSAGHQVRVLDDGTSSGDYVQNIQDSNLSLMHASIMDPQALDEACCGVDYVLHLGALISVPESMDQPEAYHQINTIGTLRVLDACVKHKVKAMVLSSSAAIYGDDPVMPKKEDMLPRPLSPYALSKYDGECYTRIFTQNHSLRASALRYFNVFGPRQNPYSAYAAAVPIFISKALKNQDIHIYGDGLQTRDFVFVKDIVAANFLALEKNPGIYNVAYGGKITILDLAQQIIALTGARSKIVHLDARSGDIKHSRADISAIAQQLGFVPSIDFVQALEDTVAYYQSEQGS